MIEIEEPPDIRACAATSVPLSWHWSASAQRWKAWEPVTEDPEQMRRHRCEWHGGNPRPWEQLELRTEPDPVIAARAAAGAAYARQQLERAHQKDGDPS